MSTDHQPSVSPPRPQRANFAGRLLLGSMLVLSGAIVGVGTTALSQDYTPRWSQGDGQRWNQGDGPRGMRDGDFHSPGGPGGPGMDGGHFGGPFGGPMGGRLLTPGGIERMTNRLAWAVDANTEQKQKLTAILTSAANDLYPMRQQLTDGRKAIAEALAAPTIDRTKLESLRAQHMQLADAASKRVTAAIADAADVLTPAQRTDLAKRLEEHGRWFRN